MFSKNPTTWTTDYAVPVGWMRQFRHFLYLYNIWKKISGDVVECGVGEGNTFAMLAYLAGNEGSQTLRAVWGFDSFEGWPEPLPQDTSPRNPEKGEWKIDENIARKRLKKSKIQLEFPFLSIQIIKGFFSETLPQFPNRPIAFLHIDADLYTGYNDALTYLFPHVASGGIVAFDEYKRFPNRPEYDYGTIEKWPGCTKAVDEYFAKHPEQITYNPETIENPEGAKYYVIKQ